MGIYNGPFFLAHGQDVLDVSHHCIVSISRSVAIIVGVRIQYVGVDPVWMFSLGHFSPLPGRSNGRQCPRMLAGSMYLASPARRARITPPWPTSTPLTWFTDCRR